MKKIDYFNSEILNENSLNSFYGGKVYLTDMGCGDLWDDADNDGTISPGDSICFESCE